MSNNINYSSIARKISLRHPLLADIGIQITYWVFAFLLYFTLVNFISKAVASLFDLQAKVHVSENIMIAMIGAIIFGTILGLIDHFIEKRFVRRSLGTELIVKFSLYAITWFTVAGVTRLIGIALEARFIDNADVLYTSNFFSNFATSSTIYVTVMIAGISFIKQMNNKFGPGIIIPMLLGKYRKPREEERVFMFMDLKSSTSYAETLGHVQYSKMIQKCYLDLNRVLPKYLAEVYQYVGDEVVLTWPKDEGLHKNNCINFYFAFRKQLMKNKDLYEKEFGMVPEFKASIHLGKIMVAEIGDIKRDIAYHGDTINTAARIQSMCNEYDKSLLISDRVISEISPDTLHNVEYVDETILKGKTEKIKLYSIQPEDD
jgi:adenylate cyclase